MIKYLGNLEKILFDITLNDVGEPWSLLFQDNATPQMEGLEELHNNIMFYLAIILFAVSWMILSIILNYREAKISSEYGTLEELIWTIMPVLILVSIAFPSFKLLYLMDEVIDPSLVIHGEGHQWYWNYQYPDFTNNDEEFVEFDSYIVPESYLEIGKLGMLEVDNRVIVPDLTNTIFFLNLVLFIVSWILLFQVIKHIDKKKFHERACNNAPKSHKFVEISKESAVDTIIVSGLAASTITVLVQNSAYLFAAALYLNMFSTHIGFLFVPIFVGLMEHIIHNTQEMARIVSVYLENPNISHVVLGEMHQWLTPYIRSYESLFNLILRIVMYLEGSGTYDFSDIENLEAAFREAGNILLGLYRAIERIIGISIDDSPIPFQDSED